MGFENFCFLVVKRFFFSILLGCKCLFPGNLGASVFILPPPMEGMQGFQLVAFLCLGVLMGFTCCQDNGNADSDVYIVTLKQAPFVHYNGELRVKSKNLFTGLDKPR